MNIFLNAVSQEWYICIFDSQRHIYASLSFEVLWNESSKLIQFVDDFLIESDTSYSQIENIVTVVWPGSFTGIRTIVLFVNTLAFIHKNIFLTPVNYFDLFDQYPIVKQSSKRDMFVKKEKNTIIEIMSNVDFCSYASENQIEYIYGHIGQGIFPWEISTEIDYESYIQKIEIDNKKTLTPLYIKKPNIT